MSNELKTEKLEKTDMMGTYPLGELRCLLSGQTFFEIRQVFLNGFPNNLKIDTEVFMSQYIANSPHQLPGNILVFCATPHRVNEKTLRL
jgi:hypothetical protein